MSPAARLAKADISAISGSPADTSTPARPRTEEREVIAGVRFFYFFFFLIFLLFISCIAMLFGPVGLIFETTRLIFLYFFCKF